MALNLRAAGRVASRLAVGDRRRRPAAILLGVGLASVVAGAAILLSVLSPYLVAPTQTARVGHPMVAVRAQPPDSAILVAPSPLTAQPAPAPAPAPVQSPVDGVWFLISVPSVGYSAVVRQGVSASVLAGGPGHYPGTPWPGQPGNVGVAGHNTFWLSFSHLKVGDRVQIRTQHALYIYEITGSKVVNPDDRTVLAPTAENRLTLTTCYPLWAGILATQRLIFTARPIGGVA